MFNPSITKERKERLIRYLELNGFVSEKPDNPFCQVPYDMIFEFFIEEMDCAIKDMEKACHICARQVGEHTAEIILSQPPDGGMPILEEYHAAAGFYIGGKGKFRLIRIDGGD